MTRRVLARAVWMAALAVLITSGLGGIGVAGAQETGFDEGLLQVRSIDARDPDNVVVRFIYTGDRPVSELELRDRGDVIETAAPVPVTAASAGGVAIALDTAEELGEGAEFERMTDAARQLIADLMPEHQVAVIAYGGTTRVEESFTGDETAALAAVDRIGVLGTRSLYAGVRSAVNSFRNTDLLPTIVLFTGGGDERDLLTLDETQSLLVGLGAPVFAVGLELTDPEAAEVQSLVDTVGGGLLTPEEILDMEADIAGLADDIRGQFQVAFAVPDDEQGGRDLRLSLGVHTLTVQYTPGGLSLGSTALDVRPYSGPPTVPFLESGLGRTLGLLLGAAAAGGLAYAIFSLIASQPRGLDSVLRPYADGYVPEATGDDEDEAGSIVQAEFLQRAVQLTGELAARRGFLARVEGALERANLPLRSAEALFVWFVAIVAVAVLGLLVIGNPALALLLVIPVVLAPPAVVTFLADRRKRQFSTQLPDMLTLLAGTLRAGYSLMQGVEATAPEVTDPMRKELGRVVTEARLGMPLEESLEAVAKRMDSVDFDWTVMAIRIQREAGGNLAEILMTVADTMIQRERLRREVNALTAEGRISAIVLGALPVLLGFVMYSINPEYIETLFSGIGPYLLVSAVLLALGGFYWMYRIIQIEV